MANTRKVLQPTMAKFTQIMVLSIGTLAGAAVGFYALEAYKVKEKVSSKV